MSLLRTEVPKPMTLAEFLDWEDRQELRHEFDGYGPIAMAGGSGAHAMIQRNLNIAVGSRLRGKPCQFFGSDLKVEVAGRIRYPDGFVTCTPVAAKTKVVRDPVVLFEVLSDSSGSTDLVAKNHEYSATASVKRYIVLAQDRVGGTVFERVEDDWIGHLVGPAAVLRMLEIGVEIPVAEFYEGLEFPPDERGTAGLTAEQ